MSRTVRSLSACSRRRLLASLNDSRRMTTVASALWDIASRPFVCLFTFFPNLKNKISKHMKGSSPRLNSPPGSTPSMDTTCLIYACMNGLDAVVEILVHRPTTNVNQADATGWCPLMAACASKSVRCVDILARAGVLPVDVSKTLPGLRPASEGRFIWELTHRRQSYHAELLVRYGKDPKRVLYTPKNGDTALHYAATFGEYSLCSVLLTKGADVNAQTDHNRTPLELACYAYIAAQRKNMNLEYEYKQTILTLLAHGARIPCAPIDKLPDFWPFFAERKMLYGTASMAVLSMSLQEQTGRVEVTPALSESLSQRVREQGTRKCLCCNWDE